MDEPSQDMPHVLAAIEALLRAAGRELQSTASGITGMRGSYGRILSLIDDQGSRPSTLAEGALITRQATGKRIAELVDRGWVTVEPDPADGRAVLVRRTPEGDRVRKIVHGAIATLESGWAARVGGQRYAVFRAVLGELSDPRFR